MNNINNATRMTEKEAEDFFSEFFRGRHHIPYPIRKWGEGFYINFRGELSTYDFYELTRLVILAHKRLIRVTISPSSPKYIKMIINKRKKEGSITERHPDFNDLKKMIDNEVYGNKGSI